jgi:hypothetical protein
MNLIYFTIAALIGLSGRTFVRHFTNKTSTISLFTVVIVTITMLMTKAYVIPYYHAETYQFFLRVEDPAFRIIIARYPKEFKKFIAASKENILSEDGEYKQLLDKIIFLNSLFAKSVGTASNKSIYDYYVTEIKLYAVLFQVNPEFVLYMEFSNQFARAPKPNLILSLADEELIKKYVKEKEAVIVSSIQNPQPPINNKEKLISAKILHDILNQIHIEYGENTFSDTLNDPDNPNLNQTQSAKMVIAFYKKILDLDVNYASIVFKYLDAQS